MSGVRRHHLSAVAATLVACATLASGAAAADTTIAVGNNETLSPDSGNASIFAGDNVTWNWVGLDFDHIIESDLGQAEQWASHPLGAVPPTSAFSLAHLFTQTGAFTYSCRVHPNRMFGTIRVADGRPTATFTMTPLAATTGQRVDFDGMASSDPNGIITGWEWDLDGNGTFVASGATPNHTYSTAGTVTVGLRVTDNSDRTHTVTQQLIVTAPPATVGTLVPPSLATTPATTPIVDPPPLVAKLTASTAAKQRGAVTRGVTIEALCDLGCVVTATGSIVYPGGPKITLTKATKTLIAGQRLKIAMLIPAKSRAGLLKHLKKGKTATATIVVTTPQGASVKKTVKLTR